MNSRSRTSAKVNSRLRSIIVLAALAAGALLQPIALGADPVAVLYTEGMVHGFLVLRSLEGKMLARGDLTQVAHGDRVTSRLVFHFRDGSLQDETVVYSQRHDFRLLSDHMVQKGPTFPQPMDVTVDGTSGQTTVRYVDDGKPKVVTEHFDLPPDVANGLILTLLKNVPRNARQMTLSMVAAAPKPRLVKLAVTAAGKDTFSIGGAKRQATHYVVKVELGGVAGVVAPLVGKQPPDSHVWILGGEVPAFLKAELPLYPNGPSCRIELASPRY
jgi:hypothetical protein